MQKQPSPRQPHQSSLPVRSSLLQRKCACGGRVPAGRGVDGECTACRQKRLQQHATQVLQPQLRIGASHDPLEQEADRVAEQVLATATNPAVSHVPPRIQRFTGQPTGATATAPASVDRALAGAGQPLAPVLQQGMGQRFGHDFSQVRIHTDAQAAESARDVNAHAYTVGHNLVFGAGQFAPGTLEGRRLIAHELTHVVQQAGFAGNNLIQRNCRNHPDESYYAGAANYCRDTGFTGMFHTGRTCYREVPVRTSYFECPPGDQVCFNANGTCEDSYDEASPVESRNSDGSCNLHHLCTWTMHTGKDVAPGLLEQATAPLAEGMGRLEREIYKLYGVPYF